MESFNQAVRYSKYAGDSLSGSTGLSIWFPDAYLPFKKLAANYPGLTWARATEWERFLNWFYDSDDLPPTQSEMHFSAVAGNNFTAFWSKSYDLAPIYYRLVEGNNLVTIFEDQLEDSSRWTLDGFTFSQQKVRSGSFALYSGQGNNLNNTATLKEIFSITGIGLVNFFASFDIQEFNDSLMLELRTDDGIWQPVKTIYGLSSGWQEYRLIVDAPGSYQLRFRYKTDNALSQPGAYVDDLKVTDLLNGRFVTRNYPDTSYYYYNKKRGNYFYGVTATDVYGNAGNLSQFKNLRVEDCAVPYSVPNPFIRDCEIILDFPDSLKPVVEIFSIGGRKIKKFSYDEIKSKKVYWDGKGDTSEEVGSGLYFVNLRAGSYRRLGKIAKVK